MPKGYWVVRIEESTVKEIDSLREHAKDLSGADVSFAAMTRTILKSGIQEIKKKQKRGAR